MSQATLASPENFAQMLRSLIEAGDVSQALWHATRAVAVGGALREDVVAAACIDVFLSARIPAAGAAIASSVIAAKPDVASKYDIYPRKLLQEGAFVAATALILERLRGSAGSFGDPEVVSTLLASGIPDGAKAELVHLMKSQPPHFSMEHAYRHRFRLQQSTSVPPDNTERLCQGVDQKERLLSYFTGSNHPIERAIQWMLPSPDITLHTVRDCILHICAGGFIILSSGGDPVSVFSSYIFDEYIQKIKNVDTIGEFDGAIYSGDVFGGNNYCHWMTDYLPRIAWAREARSDFMTLIPDRGISRYHLASLGDVGVDEGKIRWLKNGNYHIKELAVLNTSGVDYVHCFQGGSPAYAKPVLDRYRTEERSPQRKIFIKRPNGLSHAILNATELYDLAQELGFELVDPGALSVREQSQLFAEASHVVGAHGAGMTNIAFCQPATKVLELFSPVGGSPAFARIAIMRGLKYRLLVGETNSSISPVRTDNNHANFMVEVIKFKTALREILEL